jgi:hypothetical protein
MSEITVVVRVSRRGIHGTFDNTCCNFTCKHEFDHSSRSHVQQRVFIGVNLEIELCI